MRSFGIYAACSAAILLAGCTTLEPAASQLGCIFTPSHAGCSTTPTPSPIPDSTSSAATARFAQLQSVLDQETHNATQAQIQAVQAMRTLPAAQRAVAGAVQTLNVLVSDSQHPGHSQTMRTLDSVTVDLPLAAKGRAEYTQAMNVLKTLANTLADNRGSATIAVEQSAADIKARRVNTATGTTTSPQGRPVNVQKISSPTLPAGMERYTIRAGALRGQL